MQHDNGRYYPAGIYLGGLTETVVRAIDSDVVDLINRAEISGNAAGNYTGGGVGRWESGVTTSPFVPGLFQVNLLPGGAMGSGWRVKGAEDRSWVSDRNLYYPLIPGPFDIEFRPISGYSAPQLRRADFKWVKMDRKVVLRFIAMWFSGVRDSGGGEILSC